MTSTKSVYAQQTEAEREEKWHSVNRSFGGLSDILFVWDDEDISIQAAICSVSAWDSLSNLLKLSVLSAHCCHHAHINTHCLSPRRPQQVCLRVTVVMCVFVKERERQLTFGAPLPAHHLWAELFKASTHTHKHMCAQSKCITFSISLSQKVLSPSPLSHIYPVAKHYMDRREGG